MIKRTKRLSALVLILAVIISVIAPMYVKAEEVKTSENSILNDRQTFVKVEDENSVSFYGATGLGSIGDPLPENVDVIYSLDEYNKLTNNNGSSKKEIASIGTAPLPDFVDNSENEYFPEIGDQSSLGSCTFWAQVYYQFTYMMNKDLGVATTYDNTFSPQWAYNVVAGTDEMIGPYYSAYAFMKKQGNVFLKQVPYDLDISSFSPTEEIWKTSIKYRIKDFQVFDIIGEKDSLITSPNDEDLVTIKSALSRGEILTYSTYINSWNTVKLSTHLNASYNNKYSGQYAVTSQTGQNGAHRMTLVGYDDNLWIDINSNNLVDSGELGAFKIANSWGKDYGNNGFMWIAYDALNNVSCVDGVKADPTRESIFSEIARIEVLPYNTDAQLYLKYTVNTSDRTQTKVNLTAEKDGTIYTCEAVSNESSGQKIAYDGSTDATDATMILLLSNAVPDITAQNFDEYTWSVTFTDTTNDTVISTIKNAEIVNETDNTVYKPSGVYTFTLNGSEKAVTHSQSNLNHAVVYYRGYENPMINYKVGSSNWISASGVELTQCTERRGYTHKYVIDLNNSNSATLYFTDGTNTDNNGGKYFTATKGLNYYATENVATPISITLNNSTDDAIDINGYAVFGASVNGGYAPYLYQFTFKNLDTGEVTVEEYDEKETQGFHFRTAGKYKVTLDVKDFSDKVTSTSIDVEINDLPFKIDTLTSSEGKHFVGNSADFTAVTKYENIIYTGHSNNKYRFVIKDQNNNTCLDITKKCNKFDMNNRCSEITQDFTPSKPGEYTLTVSSTDGNKEYAEKSITFSVYDKLYGDSDKSADVTIMDATTIQLYLANKIVEPDISLEMADCDLSDDVNIMDATRIQLYLAHDKNSGLVGNVIEYIPPTIPPTEPPTQAPTVPPVKNKVTFTNSLNWSGTIYCYYWSNDNTAMTSWPGQVMTNSGTNEFSQTLYTFDVPDNATYIIFTNGSAQTVDITYNGGEVKYYALNTKTGNGYNVQTW